MNSKKIHIILAQTLLLLGLFIVPLSTYGTVNAAACANPNNYGSASWTAAIPEAGTYEIWARVLVPDTANDTFQLEIDGSNCWLMGGTGITANTWTWVNWYNSSTSQLATYNFSTSGNHTVKLVGSATNVQVDKIIFLGTSETCSDGSSGPSGTGDNCATAPAVTTNPSNPTTPPTTVTGSTTPDVVAQYQDSAEQTSYVVNGQVVQTSDGAAALDTSKLEDGTYTVEAIVKLKDGTEVKQQYTITVDNDKGRYQTYKTYLFGGIAAAIIGVLALLFVLQKMGKIHLHKPNMFSHQNKTVSQIQRPIIIKPNTHQRY